VWSSLKVKVYGSSKAASSYHDFEAFKRIGTGTGTGVGADADADGSGAPGGTSPGTKRKDKTKTKTTTTATTATTGINGLPNGDDIPQKHGSESLPN
jgi:hypothetical protein